MSKQTPEQPGLFASVDVVSANKLLSTQQDASKVWMNRIYYSVYFRGFYLMLILVNLACIVWTLVKFGTFPDEVWFIVLEGCLAVMVAVEVGWRMCVQGAGKFWCSLGNVADVMVSGACVVALGFAVEDAAVFIEGFSSEVVLFVRSALQYLRLILFIKSQRKAQDTLLQMINFSELAEPPKAVVQSHMPLEEEDKPSVVPNNTGTVQEADSEDRSGQPRTLMIPNRA